MNKFLLFIILSLFLAHSLQANFDQATALELARASFATYCQNSLITMKCGAKCSGMVGYKYVKQGEYNVDSFKDHSLSFTTFVNTERKRFVLAFRGTIGTAQLLQEGIYSASVPFNLCKDVKNTRTMKYFNDNYEKIMRSNVLDHLRDVLKKYPDYDYFITGHSLGGALANLAAIDLSCNGILKKEKIHLFTYGSPRVGDFNFASAVVNSVGEAWRITHNRDMVVHVPMCKKNLLGGCSAEGSDFLGAINYAWHIWPEVHYNQDFTSFKICPTGEDTSCARQYKLYNWSDHMNYLGQTQGCV